MRTLIATIVVALFAVLPAAAREGHAWTIEPTTLRAGPDETATVVTELAANVMLSAGATEDGWVAVIFRGRSGFVAAEDLSRVPPDCDVVVPDDYRPVARY